MRKLFKKIRIGQANELMPAIAFISVFFLCGAVAGCIAAKGLDGETDNYLVEHVVDYLAISKSDTGTGSIIGLAFFNTVKYHFAAFLSMFSVLGILIIPVLLAVRGFLLSFSVTSFIVMFGLNGIFLSLAVFGISCMLAVPPLLIISGQSFNVSLAFFTAGIGKWKNDSSILKKITF